MANGHHTGNGSIRISAKTAGLVLTLIIAIGGGLSAGTALIRWATKMETGAQANTDFRIRTDTAFTNHRFRVNQVLTDQERRLRELEVRAGIRRPTP